MWDGYDSARVVFDGSSNNFNALYIQIVGRFEMCIRDRIKIEGVDPKMIANNLTPSELIHPGEILKDEIEYRGISQRKLAAQMGISPTLLNEILNGKRAVSAEYALLFEAALGIDAEPLIKLQVDYNIQVAKSDKSFLERLANIRKIAAVL